MKAKEQGSQLFFVEVKDPGEVRKNILETLREILSVLQRFERFRHLRHEKLEKIQKLRILVRQANKMMNELKSRLPQTNLRAVVVKEKHAAPVHHQKKKKAKSIKEAKADKQAKIPKKEMTEIEKLESELSAIEGKLKSLT